MPTAKVQDIKPGFLGTIGASYMWLLTLVCLVTAIGLVWWSMPEQGVQIEIHFPDGHGLRAEDTLRYRGIDVGTVESVELKDDLAGVDVTVSLKPFAEGLAREGSQFWIVRPELNLGGISGLDTAVGHKYIGVLPGEIDAPGKVRFAGMAGMPPDASNSPGTEIILQGEHRLGLNSGSPVSHRGAIIGRVLAVELSESGQTVDSRVRIFEPYTYLVTSKSKFWSVSGIDLDLRWGSGVHFDIESFETVATGGVAVLTIANGGKPVRPGQLFSIVGTPDSDWFEQAKEVDVAKTDLLRAAVAVQVTWKQKGRFYGTAEKSASCVATHVAGNDGGTLRVPSDIVTAPEKAIEGSFKVTLADGTELVSSTLVTAEGKRMGTLPLPAGVAPTKRPFAQQDVRSPEAPEDCLAVRYEGAAGEGTFLHLTLEAEQIDEDWRLKGFDGDRNVWHGAPVVAKFDGRLIGFLIVEDRSASIELVD